MTGRGETGDRAHCEGDADDDSVEHHDVMCVCRVVRCYEELVWMCFFAFTLKNEKKDCTMNPRCNEMAMRWLRDCLQEGRVSASVVGGWPAGGFFFCADCMERVHRSLSVGKNITGPLRSPSVLALDHLNMKLKFIFRGKDLLQRLASTFLLSSLDIHVSELASRGEPIFSGRKLIMNPFGDE